MTRILTMLSGLVLWGLSASGLHNFLSRNIGTSEIEVCISLVVPVLMLVAIYTKGGEDEKNGQ